MLPNNELNNDLKFVQEINEEIHAARTKRVQCLYRVSTEQQVTYNDKKQADIPMQRMACRKFAAEHGWEIVFEDQEDGISGHKIRAENRDKIQLIKQRAKKKQFDILLVFMFDRIGRIADETPFVVEWFVKNGISVWSTQEGEQRFDNHTDKLINYIRFWQADGESEKTSIRTAAGIRRLTEDGYFTGGIAPYGYNIQKLGRKNKRGQDVSDLVINENEAEIVRLIYHKYVYENCGTQRIANFLIEKGIKNRSGKNWHPSSINNILGNITYTGILRSADSHSEVLEQLIIIDQAIFNKAQNIKNSRKKTNNSCNSLQTATIATKSQALLSGKVFCGHCGARLNLTTSGKYTSLAKNMPKNSKRRRYVCYGKTRKQTDCDGQTGYTAHILDDIIDKMLHEIFKKLGSVSKQNLLNKQFAKDMNTGQIVLKQAKQNYLKASQELEILKKEVLKALQGESSFSPEILNQMLIEAEQKENIYRQMYEEEVKNYADEENIRQGLGQKYDEVISYAQMYEFAEFETKKMIISTLIERIEVSRDYQVKVTFNVTLEQFLEMLTPQQS